MSEPFLDRHMEIIMTNLNRLIPLINGSFICDLIAYHEVLPEEDWKIINSKEDNYSKTESLLLAIGNAGADAMTVLKDVLVMTENHRAVEILNSGSYHELCNRCSVIPDNSRSGENNPSLSRFGGHRRHYGRTYSFCDDNDHGNASSSVNEGNIQLDPIIEDAIYRSPTIETIVSPKPVQQYFSKKDVELKHGEDIYDIKSKPRGYCLIINNVDFALFSSRKSAEEDGTFLSTIFDQLGFELNYFKNLSAGDMEAVFQKYSKMESLKDHDALVCIIMSHGLKRDLIVGSDGFHVRTESLLAYFNNFNCPNLMNKPKLFFIQACRGDEYDFGTFDETTTADAGPVPGPVVFRNQISAEHKPTWSDMCIVQSTIQGYVALRNVDSGSWFAEALGQALIDHAYEKSLHEILMAVNSKLTKRKGKDSVKQAIEVIWRGWNKSFYFNPGLYSKDCF